MSSRYLVTTADEHSWTFDQPVLFLGEWCRPYTRKAVWEGMDAIVAEPYGLERGQRERDIAYVQSLSAQLLKELTDALNAFHGTDHGLRYWEIVLGHWLQRYVTVVFNRYSTLVQALDRYEVSGTKVFASDTYSLATTDSLSAVWACIDDLWNHFLYAKILEDLGNVDIDLDTDRLRGERGFTMAGQSRFVQKKGVKHKILDTVDKLQRKLCRENEAFIISSYLPLKEEVKLQLSLGQFPKLWAPPRLLAVEPDPRQRRQLNLDGKNHQGFERFVRAQLREMIPACYLEGYEQLCRQIESLPWPANPRFIFTSNYFDKVEPFKVWLAGKVEKGVPYFAGQHGNNYGTLIGNQNWPEFTTSDRFFTWGWNNDNPKNIPAFAFKLAGQKPKPVKTDGGLLLIEIHSPFRFGPQDSYFEHAIYQEEQFRFVERLPEAVRQQLTVRLHGGFRKLDWSDDQRWKDRAPLVNIETGTVPLRDLIAQSRLVVHSYDSTGILETLALNIPTVCFWHGGLDHLLPDARPYYESLGDANILADSPEQAAKFIASNWDRIDDWWRSPNVQKVREAFCNRYARLENHPVRTMKRLLVEQEMNRGSCKMKQERSGR